MSGRTILSRPRTRIYDANYNIGHNYYKSELDRLDKKYNPRPASPLRSSVARDILSRHDEAFANEDISSSRRRAEKIINESNLFDSRGGRLAQRALGLLESGIDEETASTLKRLRAKKTVSVADDVDFESTVDNLNSHRLLERSEKALKSVGITENSRRALDETIKRRDLKIASEDTGADFVRWTPVASAEETAASIRVKQTKNRLVDLEDEMAAVTERQEARERRAARLKAIVAESTEETEAAQSAIQAISRRARRDLNQD